MLAGRRAVAWTVGTHETVETGDLQTTLADILGAVGSEDNQDCEDSRARYGDGS